MVQALIVKSCLEMRDKVTICDTNFPAGGGGDYDATGECVHVEH